jgi:hypothetical protein
VDDLDVDFRLPPDLKKEAFMTNGNVFIGLNTVHHHDRLRLDIQSLGNLYPFFALEQLTQYQHDYEQLYHDLDHQAGTLGRLEQLTPIQLARRPQLEFLASGGDPRWFPNVTETVLTGAIEGMEYKLEQGKLRVPLPGGRYYVMTSAVAAAAGLDLQLKPGEVHLDPTTATAWVHRDDWLHLKDSPADHPKGIKHILGGADQDDALWVYNFTDHDDQVKTLLWRSPNGVGEHMLLQPTATSQAFVWQRPDGTSVVNPPGDSRQLPRRIDQAEALGLTHYSAAVKPSNPGQLGPYQPQISPPTVDTLLANKGVVGAYCNYILAYKVLHGSPPPHLPAAMEDIVDGAVKNGDDLSAAMTELKELSQQLARSGKPIPRFLLPRLNIYPDRHTGLYPSHINIDDGQHWYDQAAALIGDSAKKLTARRNTLMQQAKLPISIYESVANDPEALELGTKLRQRYGQAMHAARQQYGGVITANPQSQKDLHRYQEERYHALVNEYVRQALEPWLEAQPPERHTAILRGAMISRELGETRSATSDTPNETRLYKELGIQSDKAIWFPGKIGQTALQALRELDLIGSVTTEVTPQGTQLVKQPTAYHAAQQATYQPVQLKQVWFNRVINQARAAGQPPPTKHHEVSASLKQQTHQTIRFLAGRSHEQGGFLGLKLKVAERHFSGATPKLVFEDAQGQVFGVVDKNMQRDWFVGNEAIIRQAKAGSDGNLVVMMEYVPPEPTQTSAVPTSEAQHNDD